MATKVYMEALSPTMEEGRISAWLKNEGDEVQEGDVLAEVETDKATMELSARGSGVLRKRMLEEGGTADVGSVIAVIGAEDEDISEFVDGDGDGNGGAPPAEKEEEQQQEQGQEKEQKKEAEKTEARADEGAQAEADDRASAPPAEPDGRETGGRVKASPLARRLAEESGVDLGSLQGSGPGGRIVKRDIESAARGKAPTAAAAPEVPAPAPDEGLEAYEDRPLSQMRKAIARRLTQSIGPVPHFFLTREVDMTEAQRLRARLNERFESEGKKASINDIVVKATAVALRKHPWVNAAWTGESVRLFNVVHIGIAVAVDEGLITPVIRHADRKGVMEIGAEIRELAGRAREKKLQPEEYSGSTFSISNLGMFGIEEFTAVINPPEAAILAVGAMVEKPVVIDGEVRVRPRMRITLSCDHRVVDGATGAEFLRTLVSYLEEPGMMMA